MPRQHVQQELFHNERGAKNHNPYQKGRGEMRDSSRDAIDAFLKYVATVYPALAAVIPQLRGPLLALAERLEEPVRWLVAELARRRELLDWVAGRLEPLAETRQALVPVLWAVNELRAA